MVCVDGNYNQGTCLVFNIFLSLFLSLTCIFLKGDTGGPLIQYLNGHHATIVGVSSFISGKGCESTDPSGYFRTVPYIDWIKNVTGI